MELQITDKSKHIRRVYHPMIRLEDWTEREIAEGLVYHAAKYDEPLVLTVNGHYMIARKGETVEQVLERLERDKTK